MEPLRPLFRAAVLDEHPGLSEETLDRAEALLAQRFLIDPEAEPERIAELDRQRMELLEQEMPRMNDALRRASLEEKSGQ